MIIGQPDGVIIELKWIKPEDWRGLSVLSFIHNLT